MQLGYVSAILPNQSLEEVMWTAKKIGYDCVEIMCWPVGGSERRYAGVTHIDVDSLDDRRVAEIHQLVAETGFRFPVSATTPILSRRPKRRLKLRERTFAR